MNFKIMSILLFFLFHLMSCSSPTPVLKKKNGPRIVFKEQAKCEERVKLYKKIVRYSTKSKMKDYFLGNSTIDLCSLYFKKTASMLKGHSGKIGIIFEKKKNQDKDKAILTGILEAAKLKKTSYSIKRIHFSNANINKAMSSLITKDKVGIIITWGNSKFLSRVQFWQEKLKVPTLFIDNKIKKSNYSFKVFPNKKNYSQKLVNSIKTKKLKKIAILFPQNYNKSNLLKQIIKDFKQNDIEVVHKVEYDSSNYSSMELACKKIFNINIATRKDEYKQILNDEKKKANAQGYKLNPKLAFLRAETDFDAIFIPDNFKVVNHFSQLFEYFKAPKLPLIGTHEWRSPELTKLDNKYLEGSIFIDFLGSINELPRWFKQKKTSTSSNGIDIQADYKIMGYYSGILGQKAVKKSSIRSHVKKSLKKMRIDDDFIQNKFAFKRNEFNWPSYAFEIRNSRFEPLKKPRKK